MNRTVKVLIVEDMRTIRLLLRGLLSALLNKDGQSLVVLEAADGAQGLTLASDEHPDMIISDIEMPGLNGIELCRAVKRKQSLAGVPVVLITSRPIQREKGLDAGASAFMSKPIKADELGTVIRAVLQ